MAQAKRTAVESERKEPRTAAPADQRETLPLRVRPIEPGDKKMLARLHEGLSETTVRYRYFHDVSLKARINPQRLDSVCHPHPEESVLVAVTRVPVLECDEMLGVGRLVEVSEKVAEVAVLVVDLWQDHGVGTALMQRLIEEGRRRGVAELVAYILRDNVKMQRLSERSGFALTPTTVNMICGRLRLK